MPQTVSPQNHATITLAANDLCTVNYAGWQSGGTAYMFNGGPGVVWVSFNPAVNATVGNANCYRLALSQTMTYGGLGSGSKFTLNADTAATLLSVSFP
jgi:hypothetical protein